MKEERGIRGEINGEMGRKMRGNRGGKKKENSLWILNISDNFVCQI